MSKTIYDFARRGQLCVITFKRDRGCALGKATTVRGGIVETISVPASDGEIVTYAKEHVADVLLLGARYRFDSKAAWRALAGKHWPTVDAAKIDLRPFAQLLAAPPSGCGVTYDV